MTDAGSTKAPAPLTTAQTPAGMPTDLASLARLAMAGAATALATDGVNYLVAHNIVDSQWSAKLIAWGGAFILAAGAAAWAKFKNSSWGHKVVAAAATGDPLADPAAAETIAAVTAAIANPNSPIEAKK